MNKIAIYDNITASNVALGCMRIASLTEKDLNFLLDTAIDCDINFFDHADIYGKGQSEKVFGNYLKQRKICLSVHILSQIRFHLKILNILKNILFLKLINPFLKKMNLMKKINFLTLFFKIRLKKVRRKCYFFRKEIHCN